MDVGCDRSAGLDTGNLCIYLALDVLLVSKHVCAHKNSPSLEELTCLLLLTVGREIAAALQMNYAFVCEFEELRSPLRTPQTQVKQCINHSMQLVLLTNLATATRILAVFVDERFKRILCA